MARAKGAGESIGVDRAIEAFVHGFCYTRSITHPYVPQRIGGLWVMRDGPRASGAYRNEEWVAYAKPPQRVDAIVRQNARGRLTLCVLCPPDEVDGPLAGQYKALGYRLCNTEPLMVHTLKRIPRFEAPADIERVRTEELATALGRATRRRPLTPQQMAEDAPIRQYAAVVDGQVIGWVQSIAAAGMAWCASMYVAPQHRRRGIARAMLARMLADDRKSGAQAAVLLASHTGALLYPVVGYTHIATLLALSPRKA